ncbi:MAG: HIR complex subunit [Cirrosporium novae-zelandiae]|nr:MAG: HIR complex subunit [Cirrosporium novae-zelandiae]
MGERKDHEVYSCDVSPDGSRLVTAAGDGHVRVWSTEAIYHANDPSYSKPRQLASMNYHSGTIHTVRFSPNGRYLASGADDKIVCVYNLDPSPPSHIATFGSNESPPVENWRIFRRLIGHDNDVQDLGWAHDSSILVSVGLDSKVVVWSGFTFEKLKTILNHQSHVKGITFDPANKYFATASDDRTVKIFRFTSPGPNSSAHDQGHNFIHEKTITAPFKSSPLTTYFRRCSWSPDGAHIAAANAVNGPVSSVSIIARGTWDSSINLIGHEGPVEVCAFSPTLYGAVPSSNNDDSEQAKQSMTVIACAGQDKSLTVWLTTSPRPVVITQDLAKNTISDLAWTPNGSTLFATSLDGSILAIVFEDGELGYPKPMIETEKALTKFGANRKGTGILEGPDALLLEEKSKAGEIKGVEGRMGALMGDGHTNGTAKPSNGNPPVINGSAAGPGINMLNTPHNGTTEGGPPAQPPVASPAQEDPNAAKIAKLKQRVTITKDGKKRIAPLLVSSTGGAESSLPQTQLMAAAAQASKADAPQSILDLSKPFDGLPKGGLASVLLGNKRKLAAIEGGEDSQAEKRLALATRDGTAVPILINAPEGLVIPRPLQPMTGSMPIPAFIRPAVVNPSTTVSQVRLAIPKMRSLITQRLKHGEERDNDDPDDGLVFEVRNSPNTPVGPRHNDHEPVRVTLTRRGQPLWQDFIPRNALLATGNHRFWAVGSEDCCIYIWTPAGRRLVNAFVLDSQPVILDSFCWWLLGITTNGLCYVWNLETVSAPHGPISLAPVLDTALFNLQPHTINGPSITSARINSEGRIIVSVSNGDGYAYSPPLQTWQKLSEMWWAVGSQYWNSTDASVGNIASTAEEMKDDPSMRISAGIIPHLEHYTTRELISHGRGASLQRMTKTLLKKEGYESFEATISIAHLENRVAAALMLGAKREFRINLRMYAKRLGAEGLKIKVEELFRTLIAGSFEADEVANNDEDTFINKTLEERGWHSGKSQLCGWERQDLLKEVVLLIGKNRELQRITSPYAKLFNITEEEFSNGPESDPDTMKS